MKKVLFFVVVFFTLVAVENVLFFGRNFCYKDSNGEPHYKRVAFLGFEEVTGQVVEGPINYLSLVR